MAGSFISELMKIMGSYVIVLILSFFAVGFWFRGLYLSFIKVKLSAGRKIVVNVKMPTHNYFRVGKIIEGNFLHFTDYDKKNKLINMDSKENKVFIYRLGTVNAVNVDGTRGVLMTPDLKGVNTYDPKKIDDLYVRCLYQPAVFDNKEKIVLGLLALILIGMIIVGYVNYMTYKAVAGIGVI